MPDNWDERAETYHLVEWANRQGIIEAIIDEIDLQKDDLVLDAGAGAGPISIVIAPMVRRVHALDSSKAMLDKMPSHASIVRRVGDVTAMRFSQGMFDKVVMRQVLHLIENPLLALQECHRVLREKGRMVLVEGIPPHPSLVGWFGKMLRTVKERHVFSTDEMYNLMCQAGFSITRQALYIEPQVSINNWLINSQIDFKKAHQVLEMHHELSEEKRQYYNMTITDATRCDFHFLILVGEK